jgi:hypothetical protein
MFLRREGFEFGCTGGFVGEPTVVLTGMDQAGAPVEVGGGAEGTIVDGIGECEGGIEVGDGAVGVGKTAHATEAVVQPAAFADGAVAAIEQRERRLIPLDGGEPGVGPLGALPRARESVHGARIGGALEMESDRVGDGIG